jgi:hypothetical protein
MGNNTNQCGGLALADSAAPQLWQFPFASVLWPGMFLLCGPCPRHKKIVQLSGLIAKSSSTETSSSSAPRSRWSERSLLHAWRLRTVMAMLNIADPFITNIGVMNWPDMTRMKSPSKAPGHLRKPVDFLPCLAKIIIILDVLIHLLKELLQGLWRLPGKILSYRSWPKPLIMAFFLCTCWWMTSRSLISWSICSSWRVGLVAFLFWFLASHRERASWFVSSGYRAAPCTVAFFGGMSKMDALPKVVRVSSPEVGANIGHLFSDVIN